MEEIYLTKDGYKALESRLMYLKSQAREEVAKKIGIAREFGDLSENAEYDAAKEEQAQIEAEITEIEAKLRFGKIINKSRIDTGKVVVGCHVKLYDIEFDEELEYQITGSTESDPTKGLISNNSPVGKALIGKKKGEIVEVLIPETGSTMKFKILDIHA